ncbi:MAG TPA: chitobiase/beta-hexosaminidase C-terminal domain-containing protein [Terriglobales bacterium]|nr:chitobiase/beta-hexosaminidase C-terminal domain-containing protein [Terriglobales bacterium]
MTTMRPNTQSSTRTPAILRIALQFGLFWLAVSPLAKSQDVLTYHNDVARTGQNLKETILTPANVNSGGFGKLFTVTVDGNVDAQPLYASAVAVAGGSHNVLIVVSEHDTVYSFDADTGAALWHVSALKSGETPSDNRGCGQVSPQIGITSAPVIDRTSGPNGAIYLVAMSKDNAGNYHQRLHAIDLSKGTELFSGPKDIQATYPGTGDNSANGTVTFDPAQYKERTGLLLVRGIVYTAWASHCDARPYTGWIMGYNENTLAQTTVLNVTPNGNEGAIWMAQAGLAADSSGNIYLLDANGTFDTTLNASGFPSKGDYGNAFLKLSTTKGLAVADYFEMQNENQENGTDTDLGSGGALVLPAMKNAAGATVNLAVGAGKDGNIYLVNRSSMGKFSAAANKNYQEVPNALSGGVWSAPAYFNNVLYYGAVGSPIFGFQFSKAKLQAGPVAQTSTVFGYPGVTPSISANGASNGIVWASESTSPAVLHAYDAASLEELYNSQQATAGRDSFGAGSKFMTPTIANGKVYVGTTTGVAAFGLLAAKAATQPPTFRPFPGIYNLTRTIKILDATPGSTIYYTIDNTMPTTSSQVFTTPIPFNSNMTVKTFAVAPGFQPSAVVTGVFKIRGTAAVADDPR